MFTSANQLLLTEIASTDSERIKELKLSAKWSTDNSEKKKAIFELLEYGHEGLLALREVLTITAYDDVKQTCIEAIKSIRRHHKKLSGHRIASFTPESRKPRRKTTKSKKKNNQKGIKKRAKK